MTQAVDSERRISSAEKRNSFQNSASQPLFRRNMHCNKVSNKFVAKTDAIFAGLPKTKEMVSFATNDLPLLFNPCSGATCTATLL